MPIELEMKKAEIPQITEEILGAEARNDVAREDSSVHEGGAEHGAVKKKIEISGVGEIEYTEKRVMFPEKIVQETGGVKGYIRKMVSWEELEKFRGGILDVILKLTDGNLIDKTLNHVVGGYRNYASRKDVLLKDCLLSKFGDPRNLKSDYFKDARFYGCDLATNRILSYEELFEKAGVDKDLVAKYNKRNLNDEEEQVFLEKIFSAKDIYFQQNRGINLTVNGSLWSRAAIAEDEKYDGGTCDIPSTDNIIVGFKRQSGNSVLRKYREKILSIMQSHRDKKDLIIDLDPRKWKEGCGTNDFNQALSTLLSFDEEDYCQEVGIITGNPIEGKHPQIPIVLNHPDIPELRWCHADYAAIPTKNGYNIIEMIT